MTGNSKHAFHGGASFGAIGESLQTLDRASHVISADVLDAWYDPSPQVIESIQRYLPFLVKTSPPTHGEGLREAIARERFLHAENILIGPGTSSLMFLALPRLVAPTDEVLVLDPSYGEYQHIVENVIGARLVRFELPLDSFQPDIGELIAACRKVKLAILVNPNSPTGVGIGPSQVREILEACPSTNFWIDETYIDYFSLEAGGPMTAEGLVSQNDNVIVCKSMSKFYGLSGLRVGYLAAPQHLVDGWERFSPPWSVGLIGQLAAVLALQDHDYYAAVAAETRILRHELATGLSSLGWIVTPSVTNFLLARVEGRKAAEIVAKLAEQEIFIRDANNLSPRFGGQWLRTAVNKREEQDRLLNALATIR